DSRDFGGRSSFSRSFGIVHRSFTPPGVQFVADGATDETDAFRVSSRVSRIVMIFVRLWPVLAPSCTMTPTARRLGSNLLSRPLSAFPFFGHNRSVVAPGGASSVICVSRSVAVPDHSPEFCFSRNERSGM